MNRNVAAVTALTLVLGLALGWALSTVFRSPAPLPEAAPYSVVEVREGELSRSINLNASAFWNAGSPLVNEATGVLTQRLVASGEQVSSGQVVYTVDLAPVAVAVGEVPAFRDIGLGVRGADVSQLQQMLVDAGYSTTPPDGIFGPKTLAEYKAWQKGSGFPGTGTAPFGSIVFVPRLPAVVGWADAAAVSADGSSQADPKGAVGAKLAEGDTVAQFLPPEPSFTISLPTGQRRLVDIGMEVTLSFGSYRWSAVIAAIAAPREDGSAVATLAPADGQASICGADCSAIPIAGEGAISATITVLAPMTGLLVPTGALAVAADGTAAVVSEDGTAIAVTVTAVVGGQAAVDGVAAGTRVRVPGQSQGGTVPAGSGAGSGTPASADATAGEGEPGP